MGNLISPAGRLPVVQTGMLLDEMAAEFASEGNIALRIAPIVAMPAMIGEYQVRRLSESLKNVAQPLAPGANPMRTQAAYTTRPYAVKDFALETPFSVRQLQAWDAVGLASVTEAETRNLLGSALRRLEIDTCAKFNGSDFSSTAASGLWSNTATNIYGNIISAAKEVRKRMGAMPMRQTLVVSWEALLAMMENTSIIDRLKSQTFVDLSRNNLLQVDDAAPVLARVLGLRRIIVAGAPTLASPAPVDPNGTSPDIVDIWDKTQAWVGYIDEAPGGGAGAPIAPTAAITIGWDGEGFTPFGTVQSYMEPNNLYEVLQVRSGFDSHILYADCGHRITGVLS